MPYSQPSIHADAQRAIWHQDLGFATKEARLKHLRMLYEKHHGDLSEEEMEWLHDELFGWEHDSEDEEERPATPPTPPTPSSSTTTTATPSTLSGDGYSTGDRYHSKFDNAPDDDTGAIHNIRIAHDLHVYLARDHGGWVSSGDPKELPSNKVEEKEEDKEWEKHEPYIDHDEGFTFDGVSKDDEDKVDVYSDAGKKLKEKFEGGKRMLKVYTL